MPVAGVIMRKPKRNIVDAWRISRRVKKPDDIKGERCIVFAKSVGEVKRALRKVTGIKKVRSCGSEGKRQLVEIIHTNLTYRRWLTSGMKAALDGLRQSVEKL